jgi:hypothetical protein
MIVVARGQKQVPAGEILQMPAFRLMRLLFDSCIVQGGSSLHLSGQRNRFDLWRAGRNLPAAVDSHPFLRGPSVAGAEESGFQVVFLAGDQHEQGLRSGTG